MKKILSILLAFFSLNAIADEASVKKTLYEKYKNLPPVINVKKINISNLYEVNIFGRAGYTNEKVEFLLMGGTLINLNTLEDEGEKRKEFLLSEFVESLPKNLAIKSVYGKGERVFYTFEDPDCPFCQQMTEMFHANAANLNATVYTFVFPLSIHKDAKRKASYILCSSNPEKTWKDWMTERKGLPLNKDGNLDESLKPECPFSDKAIVAGEKIARTLGYNSTPRLMFMSGNQEKGLLTIDKIIESIKTSDQVILYLKEQKVKSNKK